MSPVGEETRSRSASLSETNVAKVKKRSHTDIIMFPSHDTSIKILKA